MVIIALSDSLQRQLGTGFGFKPFLEAWDMQVGPCYSNEYSHVAVRPSGDGFSVGVRTKLKRVNPFILQGITRTGIVVVGNRKDSTSIFV